MRLAAAALALLMVVPATAQTPLTGASGQPTTQTPPLAGTQAGPANTQPGASQTLPERLPSTPAGPSRRRQTMAQRFEAANTTHDGHLTLQQAKDGRMNAVTNNFDKIDVNHRGYVTLDDIRAANRARRAARRATQQ